jgi:hypothetical protein
MERRVPLKEIKQLFPSVTIQEGTTEEDDLWVKQNGFETEDEWQGRMERAFYDIWAESGEHDCEPDLATYFDQKFIGRCRNCGPSTYFLGNLGQSTQRVAARVPTWRNESRHHQAFR